MPTVAQERANNSKVNEDFLTAIRKGDVRKINALAVAGADVMAHYDYVADVEDVQTAGGKFKYRLIKSTALTPAASPPMLTAVRSGRAESVRALLTLGCDVKADFFLNADPGGPFADIIVGASLLQRSFSMSIGADSVQVDTQGVVISSGRPIPARKTTYLIEAERLLATSRDARSQRGRQEIVDLLRQAVRQ